MNVAPHTTGCCGCSGYPVLVTRRGDSEQFVTRLTWRAAGWWHGAHATTHVKLLHQLMAHVANARASG
jgi:hypothetical protein